jgi:hypothetical protein
MKIRDESLWHELVKDLKESDEGVAFYDFVTAWADRAEQIMEQFREGGTPAEALRMVLPTVENSFERKTIWILGQCLVVLCMHWEHGEELTNTFTELEIRLVEDVTALKIAQLQAAAESVPQPPE